MSANFSCYGEKTIATPHVDRLAAEGIRFSHAFVTAPVCSPCRSALITGMYQTAIGAHHHRSGRGKLKIQLPEGVKPIPELFQAAGYFTCIGDGLVASATPGKNNRGKAAAGKQLGKTDYNFEYPASMYNDSDWSGRAAGQPFFMQVQLSGGKLRGGTDEAAVKLSERAAKTFGAAVSPDKVTLPPYYPRSPIITRDWAAYLDAVRFTDDHVGKVLERLQQEGILEDTLVIFMTDHGISHARGKQFLYNEGTHVPLVVRAPRNFRHSLARCGRAACAMIWLNISTWLPCRWLLQALLYQPACKLATLFRRTTNHAITYSQLAIAAMKRSSVCAVCATSVISTFAISIPSSLICNPTPTKTANPYSRTCVDCTQRGNCQSSAKDCSSVRVVRPKSSTIGKPIPGKFKTSLATRSR